MIQLRELQANFESLSPSEKDYVLRAVFFSLRQAAGDKERASLHRTVRKESAAIVDWAFLVFHTAVSEARGMRNPSEAVSVTPLTDANRLSFNWIINDKGLPELSPSPALAGKYVKAEFAEELESELNSLRSSKPFPAQVCPPPDIKKVIEQNLFELL